MQIIQVHQYLDASNRGDVYATGLVISWHIHNGVTAPIVDEFGELHIDVGDDGDVVIDTESMGKDHFLKVMELLYDKAEVK